jgi:hypothetical protein
MAPSDKREDNGEQAAKKGAAIAAPFLRSDP